MTTRTDSTDAMVSQLIRMVADLQVIVREQGELMTSQQIALEEMGRMVGRVQSLSWQQEGLRGHPR